MGGIKRLFFDIETSPNVLFSWRIGGKIFLSHDSIIKERAVICVCWKWSGESKVHSLTWDEGDDTQLLVDFSLVAQQADELIAHNGDRFDVRWLNGRNLINNLPPVPKYKTVDTLKVARKLFNLNSNRLDYLGKVLLGEGKIKTDFDLWKDICLKNDPAAMTKMVRYCKKDVRLLERVYERLAAYDIPKTHAGVMAGLARWTCPHCASMEVHLSKTRATPKGITQRQMQCNDCHRYYTIAESVHKDYLTAKHKEKNNG